MSSPAGTVSPTAKQPLFIPTQETFPENSLLGLSLDVIKEILLNANSKAECFSVCSLVCRSLCQIIHSETFCQQLFDRTFKQNHPNHDCSLGFFNAVKNCYTIDLNLIKGVYSSAFIPLHVSSIAIFEETLFLGSKCGNIFITDLQGVPKGSFQTHLATAVSCLVIKDKNLYSGSENGVIKKWSFSGKLLATFEKPLTGTVKSLVVHKDNIYSLNFRDNIDEWDLNGCHLKTIEFESLHNVTSIAFVNENLITSHFDIIKIWDLEGNHLKTVDISIGNPISLVVANGKLIGRSFSDKICIVDIETWKCLNTFNGGHGFVNSIAVGGYKHYLCADSLNSPLQIWDFNSKHASVFLEIEQLFSEEKELKALERFQRMPKNARNKIYGELYNILKECSLLKNDYFGCGEHAFHNQFGQYATSDQKMMAIRNYTQKASQETEQARNYTQP